MASDDVANPDGRTVPPRCRRFVLSDAMILLVGLAFSLAMGPHLLLLLGGAFGRLCRAALWHSADLLGHWPAFWRGTHEYFRNTLWYGLQVIEVGLAGMTPAVVAVRLRHPRPPLRALLSQRGALALAAMVFGLFWVTGGLVSTFPNVDSTTAAPIAVGGTVALAWGTLAFRRDRDLETGWIDGLGRGLGSAAIAAALIGLIIFRI